MRIEKQDGDWLNLLPETNYREIQNVVDHVEVDVFDRQETIF